MKNNIKIINHRGIGASVISVYDSQKAGGLTVVAPARQRRNPFVPLYLIAQGDFVGCHQLQFIDKYQMAERLKAPAVSFLLNTPYSADESARVCRKKFRRC